MSDRPSNGEFKYKRDENSDSEAKTSSEKERDEKKYQVDKAGEYVRELLQEKVELDSQKWPNATRLIDQGKYDCYIIVFIHCFLIIFIICNATVYVSFVACIFIFVIC